MASSLVLQVLRKYSQTSGKYALQIHKHGKTTLVFSNQSSLLSTGEQNDPHIVRSRLPDISVPSASLYDIIWDSGISKFGSKIATVGRKNIVRGTIFYHSFYFRHYVYILMLNLFIGQYNYK